MKNDSESNVRKDPILRRSISAKLIVAFLALAIIPMSATAYYNLTQGQSEVAKIAAENLVELSRSTAHRIERLLVENQRTSATLAGEPLAAEFLAASGEERESLSPQVYQMLQNFADTHPDYDAPGLLDANGIVVASLADILVGQDRSFRDYFQASIQGQPYVSSMLIGRATGRPGVFLTNPVVTAEGEIVGINIVWLKGDTIWATIDDVVASEEGLAYLVDQDGIIIAHPNRDLLYHSLGELTPEAVVTISATIRFGTVEDTDTPLIPESLGMDDLAAELAPPPLSPLRQALRLRGDLRAVSPDPRGKVWRLRWHALMEREEIVRNFETQWRRYDGTVIWVRESARTVRDADGRVLYYEGAAEDVTERRQAAEALQRYTERLRTLRALDGAILAAWSPQDIAQTALRHVRQLVPCLGASVLTFDFEAQEATLFAVHINGETSLEEGTRLPLEGILDVEAFRQGQVLVKEDLLADSQPPPVMQAMQATGIRSYVAVPLIAQGELIGALALGAESPAAFAPEHVDIAREVGDQLAVGLHQARLREQIQRHADELEQRVAERTAELRLVNAELARAARAKDDFLASMSHELRTPLTAILGMSEILWRELYGPLGEKQLKSVRTIEESGHHLLALINDILDVAKVEAGKLELELDTVSVPSTCEVSLRLVKQAAHEKQLKLSSALDSQVTTIQADGRRLKQILVNLLSNAVKFTPEGGEIGLEVVGDALGRVVHFTVRDTGIGIAPEDVARLFQPFVQLDSSLSRQYTGTGLGLSLVRRLAELHGGSVSVESEVGKGSRFTVSLPWKAVGDEETRGQGEGETRSTSPPLPLSPSPCHCSAGRRQRSQH